jgi:endoglucanase
MSPSGKVKSEVPELTGPQIMPKARVSPPYVTGFALAFVLAGLVLTIHVLAATRSVTVDPSDGSISGLARVIDDTSAIGGRAVEFGASGSSTPPTQVGAPSPTSVAPPVSPLPPLPLTTNGRFIVSKSNTNSRVKLVSVNWYGFEQADNAPAGLQYRPLSTIVGQIKALGVNSVRLPWATDSWNSNPVVPSSALTANPGFMGLHLRNLMDKVVNALAGQGIMVVLDNHTSSPEWCCSNTDGNALWWEDYNPSSPPSWSTMTVAQQSQLFQQGNTAWEQAWQNIITRYSAAGTDPQPAVIGADLRNEPRNDTTLGLDSIWGGQSTPTYENWQQAATQAGDLLLGVNPNLLIMVEGIDYSVYLGGFDDNKDLPANPTNGYRGAGGYPVVLSVPHQLVYAPHNYSWDSGTSPTKLGQWWGYLLSSSSYQAPIWLGEFGTCNTSATNCLTATSQGVWWQTITKYLSSTDVDWSYWALNGTRIDGSVESYGLLNSTWNGEAMPQLTQSLRGLEAISQRP